MTEKFKANAAKEINFKIALTLFQEKIL